MRLFCKHFLLVATTQVYWGILYIKFVYSNKSTLKSTTHFHDLYLFSYSLSPFTQTEDKKTKKKLCVA